MPLLQWQMLPIYLPSVPSSAYDVPADRAPPPCGWTYRQMRAVTSRCWWGQPTTRPEQLVGRWLDDEERAPHVERRAGLPHAEIVKAVAASLSMVTLLDATRCRTVSVCL